MVLPREKATQWGIESLEDKELLALVLESAGRGNSVFILAEELLALAGNLPRLLSLSYEELTSIKGIKQAKAYTLMAVFEIYRRILQVHKLERVLLNSNDKVTAWVRATIGFENQENFFVLFLNNHLELIRSEVLFKGSADSSLVSIKELLRKAILYRASNLVIAHNHPSGHCYPSSEDKKITEAIQNILRFMDMRLVDHIIVSPEDSFSFRKENLL